MSDHYLPAGLPAPKPNALHWEGARSETLKVQCNPATGAYQWPAQWIAHDTQSFELEWVEVAPRGVIYSWTRAWHPVHPALKSAGPYIIVVVALPHAGGIRMLGNLLGDPGQVVEIGTEVEAVFEHHNDAAPPFTLVQWLVAGAKPGIVIPAVRHSGAPRRRRTRNPEIAARDSGFALTRAPE